MNGDGHFFHFWLELPFLGKFGPKNQNCKFKRWNLIFRLIRICRIQHGVHFICFRLEIPFLDNLVQKIKTANLSWNVIFRLIWVCRIQRWCSFYLSETGNTLFGQTWPQKIKIVSLSWNFRPQLIRIWRMQWCCSMAVLFCFRPKTHFLGKFGPENQNS